MEMYQSSKWKIYLGLVGLLIIVASAVYTGYLVKELRAEENRKVKLFAGAYDKIFYWEEDFEEAGPDFTFLLEFISSNETIPLIVVDDRGNIDSGRNYGEEKDTNKVFLAERITAIEKDGYSAIESEEFGIKVYYEDSTILTLLKYFPFVQFLLIAAFVTYGYIGINASRRSEQNRIWAGMAKETAHQLGTPITAIVAWIEHLKMMRENDEEILEIAHELENDVDRLNLIADRFSKIGSEPKLTKTDIFDELEKSRVYMQRRASRKIEFEFPKEQQSPLIVNINSHLFNWVIENLLRNALDAMGGKGKISAKVSEESKFINIDISDTGSGIPSSKFKTIFKPGFTTKKRGWGLGLSLAKRIIETYHDGRIFVKKSVINEGTTFSIKLPKY